MSTKPVVSTRMRSAGANTLLALGALAFAFVLGEAGARILYHPENLGTIIQFDRHLGWSLKPRSTLHSVDNVRDLDYTIRINSYGMREREFERTPTPGRRRVVFVGDSFGFGVGVDASRRLSDYAARALPRDEVLNASVCGWGTDQELIHYERVVRSLQPDVVVLTFCMSNDVLNNMLDHNYLGTAAKPWFVLEGDSLALRPGEIPSPRIAPHHRARSWLKRSRLLLFAKRRIDAVRTEGVAVDEVNADHPGYGPKEAERAHSHWSVYQKEYDAATEEGWRVTEAILERFARLCKEDGTALIVLAFPMELEVDDAWREQVIAHARVNPDHIDLDKPFMRLESICRRLGVEFIHPVEEFRSAARHHRLYFERDVHPNEFGHAVAARVVLEALHDRHGIEYAISDRDRPYMEPDAH